MEDVNLDILDHSGLILLSLATENYEKLVVGLLQARETTIPSVGERLRVLF